MAYYIDDEKVSLEELYQRIQSTDLVPSRAGLLDGMKEKFEALKKLGIASLKDLRSELKNPKKLETFSMNSGLETEYLILLRREIEGYFPKPFSIKEFCLIPDEKISVLAANGISNSAELYEATHSEAGKIALSKGTGIDFNLVNELARLCDLTRVQWISPTAARMLVGTGIKFSRELAGADAEKVCEDLDRINTGGCYFKGKIGLRDVKRLVKAAGDIIGNDS